MGRDKALCPKAAAQCGVGLWGGFVGWVGAPGMQLARGALMDIFLQPRCATALPTPNQSNCLLQSGILEGVGVWWGCGLQ